MTEKCNCVRREGKTREELNRLDALEALAEFYGHSVRNLYRHKARGLLVLKPRYLNDKERSVAGSLDPGDFEVLLPRDTDRVIVNQTGSVCISDFHKAQPQYLKGHVEGDVRAFLNVTCVGSFDNC